MGLGMVFRPETRLLRTFALEVAASRVPRFAAELVQRKSGVVVPGWIVVAYQPSLICCSGSLSQVRDIGHILDVPVNT